MTPIDIKAFIEEWSEKYGECMAKNAPLAWDNAAFKAFAKEDWSQGFRAGIEFSYREMKRFIIESTKPTPNYPSGTSEAHKNEDTDTIISHTENSI